MAKFLVAGITQIETIVKVKSIPIDYKPLTIVPNSVFTSIGGTAYNVSLALTSLGDNVRFVSMIGKDSDYSILNPHDSDILLPTKYIKRNLQDTPTSVILYDDKWNQQIFEDIKDAREAEFDMTGTDDLIDDADMVVLSNANFCRPFCYKAKEKNKKIAVNIHSFSWDKVKYNTDFYKAANIIYMSGSNIGKDPYDFVTEIADGYDIDIVLLGQGKDGAILYDRKKNIKVHYNSVSTLDIVNTAGAGNALLSCFLHYYMETGDSVLSIRNALLFASYKIGFMGTSSGFMTTSQLKEWHDKIWPSNDIFSEMKAKVDSNSES